MKSFFKIRQSKVALNQILTLKLGVTPVLTVTQVYVFVNTRERLPSPPSNRTCFLMQVLIFQLLFLLLIHCQHAAGKHIKTG